MATLTNLSFADGILTAATEASGVVTVSDLDNFARNGGMIRLIKEANKVRFRINVDAGVGAP